MLHRLTVSEIRRETPDAVSIVFDIPQGLKARFVFQPGQYLTLEAEVNGERVRRAYSICSGVDDGEIRVAVKEIDGGRFSSFVNRLLQAGNVIGVMEPRGRFVLPPAPKAGRIVLAAVAGSGITPVLSIASTVLARESHSRLLLVCGNKRRQDILFRTQIAKLEQDFSPRLLVRHILSREHGGPGFGQGRIDGDTLTSILGELNMPMSVIDRALLCGPPEMVANLSAAFQRQGLASDKILAEFFRPAAARSEPRDILPEADTSTRHVEIRLGGRSIVIDARPGETVVDAARRSGLAVPYSCGRGTCCSCVARVVEGDVETESDAALEEWEREAGFVLTCQSRPAGDRLVVDYDAAF
ncbi:MULTISPECIES: 2Fe-2S iron-sulfur cluster-binding protein [unclassified Mesorhizobium]|uniref:2Fe-2S iron-sulfur cluster-binding protein n=1 Tax=unclassified Mesorhizobium TaxID=325217 RepID=UPI000FE6A23C|nr:MULTISPECIES: 2Fe-2S iron-sulfur cluster-binding protein [unclassified Mesorhizobium]RWB93047.1 MAG: 2Fe-2S iron-sulfur cluster binding domain-containing protein [Mesorhizobium sp.]TGV18075.1 2Fe-2S iron-sulfur cluster binding domain-containing protein [Mesorhizobium sp. M4B.F.Ca.ET.143.01.1.1]